MPDDLADIRSHIGARQTDNDTATAAPVMLFQKTLGRRDLEPADGVAIPPGWHMLYFLPCLEQRELGPDGAPTSTGVIPEMPLPRRMYAGVRLAFHEPIRIGDRLHRETELIDLTIKDGSTGRLAFTT
ncbi:MAG: MaoC family dehydratase N-terminal domain-containing protein, partial [Alphaproteobacteria bacterium]|nr:MaoC family dehydratase N-terminal domain-containing protein [Alphaproteobacteria bacterium]